MAYPTHNLSKWTSEYVPPEVVKSAERLEQLGKELEKNKDTQIEIKKEIRLANSDDVNTLKDQLDALEREERVLSDAINEIVDGLKSQWWDWWDWIQAFLIGTGILAIL